MAQARSSVRSSAASFMTGGKRMAPNPYLRVNCVSMRTSHASAKSGFCSTVISVAPLQGVISSLNTPGG